VHFVKTRLLRQVLGEPPFPPVFAALANALYKLQGNVITIQPFYKKQLWNNVKKSGHLLMKTTLPSQSYEKTKGGDAAKPGYQTQSKKLKLNNE